MNRRSLGPISPDRPMRLRVPARLTSPSRDGWLSDTLDALQARSGAAKEHEALAYLVERIDDAMIDQRLDRLAALLDALDPGALRDDVALTPVIASLPARLPLRNARARYAGRVRAELLARGWSEGETAQALDDLL